MKNGTLEKTPAPPVGSDEWHANFLRRVEADRREDRARPERYQLTLTYAQKLATMRAISVRKEQAEEFAKDRPEYWGPIARELAEIHKLVLCCRSKTNRPRRRQP